LRRFAPQIAVVFEVASALRLLAKRNQLLFLFPTSLTSGQWTD